MAGKSGLLGDPVSVEDSAVEVAFLYFPSRFSGFMRHFVPVPSHSKPMGQHSVPHLGCLEVLLEEQVMGWISLQVSVTLQQITEVLSSSGMHSVELGQQNEDIPQDLLPASEQVPSACLVATRARGRMYELDRELIADACAVMVNNSSTAASNIMVARADGNSKDMMILLDYRFDIGGEKS